MCGNTSEKRDRLFAKLADCGWHESRITTRLGATARMAPLEELSALLEQITNPHQIDQVPDLIANQQTKQVEDPVKNLKAEQERACEWSVLESVDKIRELVEQGRVSPQEQRAHTKALLRALRNPEALKAAVEAVNQTVRDRFH